MCLWQHKEKAQYRTTGAHPKLQTETARTPKQRRGPESYFRPNLRRGAKLQPGELLLLHLSHWRRATGWRALFTPFLLGRSCANRAQGQFALVLSIAPIQGRRARFDKKKEPL